MSKKSTQEQKYSTGLAGEFLVAGELLRRGFMAAVTYGTAKKADVLVAHETRAARLEVKSTPGSKWVIGKNLPEPSGAIWVLVYLPPDTSQSPSYFVLTSAELRAILKPEHDAYHARYRAKHGRDYDKKGVVSLQRKLIDNRHRSAWDKIGRAVGLATTSS